jgi:hypothetical protein
MPEHLVGFQVSQLPQNQQQQQVQTETARPERISVTSPSNMGEFIVDDLKLFVPPVTAVMDELKRQLKR